MKKAKKFIPIIILAAVVAFAAYALAQPDKASQDENKAQSSDSNIVSEDGVHTDPTLAIYIKGEKQQIPANLGLGQGHNPIHTHDANDVVHWEIEGKVTKDNMKLGKFFEFWGKPFSSTQIFDSTNGSDGKVTMTVNDTSNTEFENYVVQNNDKIEIRYE